MDNELLAEIRIADRLAQLSRAQLSHGAAHVFHTTHWRSSRAEPDAAQVVELLELAMAYGDATTRVTAAIDAFVVANWAARHDEPNEPPDAFPEALGNSVRMLVYDRPPPFSRSGQQQ